MRHGTSEHFHHALNCELQLMDRQRLLSAALLVTVFGLLTGLVLLRIQLVDDSVGSYIACKGCFHTSVIMTDMVLFGLAAGILLLASILRPIRLGRLTHLLLGVLFLVYVTDLIVLRLFNSRLFLSDAALFVAESSTIWNQFYTGIGGWLPAFAIVAGLILVFVVLYLLPPVQSLSQRVFLAAVLAISLTAGTILDPEPYVNEWAVSNVFSANLASTERVKYSAAEQLRILAEPVQGRRVSSIQPNGMAAGRNVIVVMVESWSAWQSTLFGGYQDWSPHFDAAAREGQRFTDFHSIGFATTNGLVGILAGQQIWSPFLSLFETPPFHSIWGVERTLPSVFSSQGYHTAFLTSGPLKIYRKGDWITNLGFDHAEGNEHPFYKELPRYAFGAPSDRALYTRASEWQDTATEPYLLVIETVTTHQPYTDPETGEQSMEGALKFAGRAFDEFLQRLKQSGYFDNGILLVLSDHRSMTPIPAMEIEKFGPGAHSRVPAFILGKEFAPDSVDARVFSQSDLVPSFELWLSGTALLQPEQAVMFGQPAPTTNAEPNCAYHSRGDMRGVMEVICNDGRGQVRLDGDQTRFTHSEGFDTERQTQILELIARLRLEGMQRNDLWEAGAIPARTSGLDAN